MGKPDAAETKALHRQWEQAFKAACRGRGMRFVSGEAYIVDDVYITSVWPTLRRRDGGRMKFSWTIRIKPLALDDVLWAAFLPDVEMGPRMRLNRRINGAFTITPLQIDSGLLEAPITDDPGAHWEALLDDADRVRTDFCHRHPTIPDFLEHLRTAEHRDRPVNRLREIATLLAAGMSEEAAAMADTALAAGEHGPMSSNANVYEYLSAFAKGQKAWDAFQASLVPTHDLELITERSPGWRRALSRHRHPGRFLDHLDTMDGVDVWAVILDARVTSTSDNDPAAIRYLQAAGSASAMTIEIRHPGGSRWDAVPLRSVVGHPHDGTAALDVAIDMPRHTELASKHEIFRADEAAELFGAFYRTGDLGDQYTLRPVEMYTADGAPTPVPPAGI